MHIPIHAHSHMHVLTCTHRYTCIPSHMLLLCPFLCCVHYVQITLAFLLFFRFQQYVHLKAFVHVSPHCPILSGLFFHEFFPDTGIYMELSIYTLLTPPWYKFLLSIHHHPHMCVPLFVMFTLSSGDNASPLGGRLRYPCTKLAVAWVNTLPQVHPFTPACGVGYGPCQPSLPAGMMLSFVNRGHWRAPQEKADSLLYFGVKYIRIVEQPISWTSPLSPTKTLHPLSTNALPPFQSPWNPPFYILSLLNVVTVCTS